MTAGSPPASVTSLRAMPLWPLFATLAVQTLATMALFSLPAAAPAVAKQLGVPGALVGVFVSLAYGIGIISALFSPGFIHRYGAVRVSQVVLLCVAGMLLTTWGGSLSWLALAGVILGLGYGATAPASTHLLVPQTPPSVFNLVMSVRQIGVPLGGVLGALIVPPLVLLVGWRLALLAEVGPVLLLIVLLQLPRKRWDAGHDKRRRVLGRALLLPFRLLREDARIQRLSVASFFYSGAQLCFVAFTTVQLTTVGGFDLVHAGQMLAVYQTTGATSRPVWGWIADRFLTPAQTLAVHGGLMVVAMLLAGEISPAWPPVAVLAVMVLAGCSAGGYTGVAYAEYAHLGGARRTESTGLGTAVMFAGVMLIPSAFGLGVAAHGNFALSYAMLAGFVAVSAVLLCVPTKPP